MYRTKWIGKEIKDIVLLPKPERTNVSAVKPRERETKNRKEKEERKGEREGGREKGKKEEQN